MEEEGTGHGPDIASGIYGTILVTAVIAGASEDPHVSVWSGMVIVLVTTLVFWLAHVYANLMALHHTQRRLSSRAQVREEARREWPLVQAGALPILLLLLFGATGLVSRDAAFAIAMWAGVAVLFIWGLILARRAGWSVPITFLSASISAALGVVIIILKIIVSH